MPDEPFSLSYHWLAEPQGWLGETAEGLQVTVAGEESGPDATALEFAKKIVREMGIKLTKERLQRYFHSLLAPDIYKNGWILQSLQFGSGASSHFDLELVFENDLYGLWTIGYLVDGRGLWLEYELSRAQC